MENTAAAQSTKKKNIDLKVRKNHSRNDAFSQKTDPMSYEQRAKSVSELTFNEDGQKQSVFKTDFCEAPNKGVP